MATSLEYIEFVCSQISELPNINYKRMFGEFMIYCNNKPIFLVCDATVYVKMLHDIAHLMTTSEHGIPYKSAKEHYVLDIDNKELTLSVARILEQVIPVPKPRKKKVK